MGTCGSPRTRATTSKITTAGTVTEFPLPNSFSSPDAITAGPDGKLWFTEFDGNRIGSMTTAGVFVEYTIPTAGSIPIGMTTGSDGNLWFTEEQGNNIGQVTPAGTFTEYPITTSGAFPWLIALGPDGTLWFAEYEGNKVGQVDARAAKTSYGLVTDAGFAMAKATVSEGTTVRWTFQAAANHTVTESAIHLFDSHSRVPGSAFQFTFFAAGSYTFGDTLHPTLTGKITVPMNITPTSGTMTTTFKVKWATKNAPSGYLYDVQIQRPGGTWTSWLSGQQARNAGFLPDAGAGTYQFRALLRNTQTQATSGYSSAKAITVN